jgi:hypothetical protein
MTEDEGGGQVTNPAGMPEMHPPEGGPNADPTVPDPGQLVPGRPGFPEDIGSADPGDAEDETRDR